MEDAAISTGAHELTTTRITVILIFLCFCVASITWTLYKTYVGEKSKKFKWNLETVLQINGLAVGICGCIILLRMLTRKA